MAGIPFWGLNEAGVTSNEGPTYFSDPWDTFYINELQFPGKCWLEGNPGGLEVETYKGKNQTAAAVKVFGYLPKQFGLVVQISTPEQWEVYQELHDAFWAGPQKAPPIPGLSLHVRHPDLQRLRVDKAVLIDAPISEWAPDLDGARNFRWTFQHSSLPKATKTYTAKGALPPEDTRLPASNARLDLPSTKPENTSLDGPPLITQEGAE
jgi:hypothetical protein